MTDTRVVIDLNETHPDGLSMILLAQTEGHLEVGDTVRAVEPEDGVSAPAEVVSINEGRGYALVRVDWRELERETPAETQSLVGNIFFGFTGSHIHLTNMEGVSDKIFSNLKAATFGVSDIKRSYSKESGLQSPPVQQTQHSELVA